MAEEQSFESLFEAALTELNDTAQQPTVEDAEVENAETEVVEAVEETAETETDDGDQVTESEGDDVAAENSDETNSNGPIAVTESDVIVLPDGTEVSVKEAALRQADYTRKTQALADERKAIEAERAAAQSQIEYVENLTKAWQTNQAEVVSGFVASTEDPTLTISQVIVDLAKAGKLDQTFLNTFGITPDVQEKWVSEAKGQSELAEVKARLNRFEAERAQQEQLAKAQAEEAALIAEYDNQWAQIKAEHRLNLDAHQEAQAKLDLLQFALDNGLTNLKVAYKALNFDRSQKTTAAKKDASSSKKAATGAITAKSTGGSVAGNRPPNSIEDAAWAAFQELTSRQ